MAESKKKGKPAMRNVLASKLWNGDEITSPSRRTDLGQVCSI